MERRFAIDVAAISEIGDEFDPESPGEKFKWVPTYVQWADHLHQGQEPGRASRDPLRKIPRAPKLGAGTSVNFHDLVIEHFGMFVEHLGMSDELYGLICEHLGKNSVVTLLHDNYLPRLDYRRWVHSCVNAHHMGFEHHARFFSSFEHRGM